MMAVTNATNAIIIDSDGGVTSFSSGTCTITSETWISYVLEVMIAPHTGDLSQTNGRAYNTNNGRMYASGFRLHSKRGKVEGYSWHCNPHTFASRLVVAGVDLRTVAELLGHRTLQMVMRYSDLAPEHQASAVDHQVKR
jgi:hypothetical protein